ncbi:MAG TPA: hypothetical protein VK506_01435, partial [Conexibacter sp.]|nr:hypothetical protein [Conexibacter sp.]
RRRRCRDDTFVFHAPSGDFELAVCEGDCGWWGAKLRGKPYLQGGDGLGSEQLEELQRRLRADGRDDLADSLVRIQVALEEGDDEP